MKLNRYLFLLLFLSFVFFCVFKLLNLDSIFFKSIYPSSVNDSSNTRPSNQKLNKDLTISSSNEIVSLDTLKEIIENSRNLELCNLDLEVIADEVENTKEIIFKSLSTENYKLHKNDLLYLVSNKVISLRDSLGRFNDFLISDNNNNRNVVYIDSINDPRHEEFLLKYQEFKNILESHKLIDIAKWIESNKSLITKSMIVDLSYSVYNYSFSELISIEMQTMPYDLKSWISNNVVFTLDGLNHSIAKEIDTELLLRQIENLNSDNVFYNSTEGNNYSLEDLIFESGNTDLIIELLDGNIPGSASKGIVPVQNRLFASLFKDSKRIEQQTKLLEFLSRKNIVPEFVFDESINAYRLLGTDSIFLTDSLGRFLDDIGLKLRISNETDFANNLLDRNRSSLDQNLIFYTEKLEYLQEEYHDKEIKCDGLSNIRGQLKPRAKVLKLSNYVTSEKYDDVSDLKMLYTISDLLSLEYINRYQNNDITVQFFESINKDSLVPAQQNLILNDLCNKNDRYTFFDLLDAGWHLIYIDESCKQNYNSWYNNLYSKIDNRAPSLVYQRIDKFDYLGALNLLDKGFPTNGFQYGPDSLSLLLDKIVPFDNMLDENTKSLLYELIKITEIDENHCHRLLLLKLKVPIYFSSLEDSFNSIMSCELYSVKILEKLEIINENLEKSYQ